MKVSTNYEECLSGNLSTSKTSLVYLYFNARSKDILDTYWNNDTLLDSAELLQYWERLSSMPIKSKQFLIQLVSRLYEGFPSLSSDHRLLLSKCAILLITIDDPIETLSRKKEWWNVGKIFLNRLRDIYLGREIVYSNFPMSCIPDSLQKELIQNIAMSQEVYSGLKKNLHSSIHSYVCKAFLEYLNAIEWEQKYFESDSKILVDRRFDSNFQDIRISSIGFKWNLIPLFTDPKIVKYISLEDPILSMVSWTVALQNDIIGCPRDRGMNDFSPLSQSNFLLENDGYHTYDDVIKEMLIEINELKYATQVLISRFDNHEIRSYYDMMTLLAEKCLDVHLLTGINSLNDRYGWKPIYEE